MVKANLPPKKDLHGVIKRAKAAGITEVVVGFSCGKDSLVTLDLCCQHFDRVEAYFMYFVQGLSFQQKTIRSAERRYGINVIQVPSWTKSRMYRQSILRNQTKRSSNVPRLTIKDIDKYIRYKTGIEWIATGELACESLQRMAQFKQTDGFDPKRKRMQPLCWWRPQDVYTYLNLKRIALPVDYFKFNDYREPNEQMRSYASLWPQDLAAVRDNYPDDFEKICREFPLARAQVLRWDMQKKREAMASSNQATAQ
jgi:phosphoadenosine phosphosulfate reductase